MSSANQTPLVSVAICTYNGAAFLKEQLNSVVDQTYKNLEIIIVDDQSKDDTLAIITSYTNRYPSIKLYRNEFNLGYIKNFEKAISFCSGDYIALCDQDDIWDLNKIEIMAGAMGDHVLLYHDSKFVNSKGEPINKKLSDVVNMYSGTSCRPFLFFNCLSGHALMFKKELVSYAIPFPKEVFHDHWIAYVATNIGSILYLDRPLVNYRQHENSDTNILRLEGHKNKKNIFGKEILLKTLDQLEIFASFKYNSDQNFISTLLKLYRSRLNKYFCFSLVIFMYSHFRSLLFISKKNMFSKLNFIYKHIWGIRFKADYSENENI